MSQGRFIAIQHVSTIVTQKKKNRLWVTAHLLRLLSPSSDTTDY